MKLLLKGSFSDLHPFLTQQLPQLASDTFFNSQLGGSLAKKIVPQKWKVLRNEEQVFEVSIFLGRISNSLSKGARRITVRSSAQGSETLIEVFETQNSTGKMIVIVVGFLFCVIPGAIMLFGNFMTDKYMKTLIRNIIDKIVSRFPDAALIE